MEGRNHSRYCSHAAVCACLQVYQQRLHVCMSVHASRYVSSTSISVCLAINLKTSTSTCARQHQPACLHLQFAICSKTALCGSCFGCFQESKSQNANFDALNARHGACTGPCRPLSASSCSAFSCKQWHIVQRRHTPAKLVPACTPYVCKSVPHIAQSSHCCNAISSTFPL